MSKVKDIELLNTANENNMLSIITASLISSDALVSLDACDKAIELIKSFLEALPETNIEEKDRWKKTFEDCLGVAERDRKNYL